MSLPSPPDKSIEVVSRGKRLIAQPVFLVGPEHSGTSLMGMMLDHHPMLSFFCDFPYAVEMMPKGNGWPDLREYHEYLRLNRLFNDAKLVIAAGLDYPQLVDSFLRQKRHRDRKPLVGATVHRHFDRLLRIWPDARFIHLVRDGRAVAWSTIEAGAAGNMYAAVEPWIEAETLWAKMRSQLAADRWMELQYEVLVTRPEAMLAHVCEFLDIPYDQAMLSYSKHTSYSPPSPYLLARWRKKLSSLEIHLAEAHWRHAHRARLRAQR